MNNLNHVFAAAVWGSLAASAMLGAFMGVQAIADRARRWRFAVFAAICWALTTLDFSFSSSHLSFSAYESLRLVTWGWYAAAVLLLLSAPVRWVVAAAIGLPTIGGVVWGCGRPDLATSVTFPISFAIAALAHGRHYWRQGGYSSSLLCPLSVAMGMLCSQYHAHVATGDSRILVLGYGHWAVLNLCAVAFAWTHLPRELQGRSPVVVARPIAVAFFAIIVSAEAAVCLGLYPFFSWPPTLYLAGNLLFVVVTLVLYFHQRHRLVIHTDNIAALLDDRTASLQQARRDLAAQNDLQAARLREQEREIQAKTEVIERQRRVELAAQTAGQAAHDIQNLISPILTYVSRIQQVATMAAVKEMAQKIRTQAERLLDLNAQLLALSRRGRVEVQPVNLSELLRDVLDRFPGEAVGIDCPGECWVQGSWSQLSRAIANLVRNALDAVAGRGRVVVRCGPRKTTQTRRCHLGFLSPGNYAYLEVEDTGPGIPADILERIFEPFFSSKSASQTSGTGLGLSIVAAVVDDHKGVLDLHTGREGTRFTLYLPSSEAPHAEEETTGESHSATVLVAENDSALLQQYSRTLEEAGYSILTAEDGVEAVGLLQEHQVDLLLLDLQMPRMDGAETFFAARNLRPGVRAVVHSSYVDDEQVNRLRALGVSAFLQKPASRAEVLRALRHALAERRLALQ